jgi:predicted amidohydrolase
VPDPIAYRALALQTRCDSVSAMSSPDEARAAMTATIARISDQVFASKQFLGPDVALVVLPEYFLTGFPMGDPTEVWMAKAALDTDGREYELLGAAAQRSRVYLAGNTYELDAHFPGLFFQTSFIINPSGDVIVRYRRLHSMFAATPYDVWDAYLDRYGLDGVFPVADTDIGRLACIASEEILIPELARCFAMRGAEVFCHSTSEVASTRQTPKDVAKLARAIENLAFVVSANSGGLFGTAIPAASTDGKSQIVNHLGQVLAEASTGESMTANAEIDIEAMRRYRRRPGMGNLLARNRFDLWAASYGGAAAHFHPANTIAREGAADRAQLLAAHTATIARLVDLGVIA